MATSKRCRSCGDCIEEGWWEKQMYVLTPQQVEFAQQYCEECGREKLLGIVEAPKSGWERFSRELDSGERDGDRD